MQLDTITIQPTIQVQCNFEFFNIISEVKLLNENTSEQFQCTYL